MTEIRKQSVTIGVEKLPFFEEILGRVKGAKTKVEKQQMSAEIVSVLPELSKTLAHMEQTYNHGLRDAIIMEGSKTGGMVVMEESDLYRDLKITKKLYDTMLLSLKVLDMYT